MKSPYEIVQVVKALKALAKAEAEQAAAKMTPSKKTQYGTPVTLLRPKGTN